VKAVNISGTHKQLSSSNRVNWLSQEADKRAIFCGPVLPESCRQHQGTARYVKLTFVTSPTQETAWYSGKSNFKYRHEGQQYRHDNRSFPQPLQTKFETQTQIRKQHRPSTYFPFRYLLNTLPVDTTAPESLTASKSG
jgi:hypothetical protein